MHQDAQRNKGCGVENSEPKGRPPEMCGVECGRPTAGSSLLCSTKGGSVGVVISLSGMDAELRSLLAMQVELRTPLTHTQHEMMNASAHHMNPS